MANQEAEYYRRRAEAEATRALEAPSAGAAAAHSQLASLYMDMVEVLLAQPADRVIHRPVPD